MWKEFCGDSEQTILYLVIAHDLLAACSYLGPSGQDREILRGRIVAINLVLPGSSARFKLSLWTDSSGHGGTGERSPTT